jgi:hypothetical protein
MLRLVCNFLGHIPLRAATGQAANEVGEVVQHCQVVPDGCHSNILETILQMEEWRMKHLSLCWTSIVNSWETWNLFIQDMWIHVNLYQLGHVRTTKFLTSWSSWDESLRYSPHNRDILIMVPTQGFIMFYPRRKVICVYLKIPRNLLTNHHLSHSKSPFWGYTVYSPFSDTHQSLSHQGISSGSAPGSTTTM